VRYTVGINIIHERHKSMNTPTNKEVYIITANGSVSSEAYSDITKAREFVLNRIKSDTEAYSKALNQHYLISIISRGTKYQIYVVNVK